MSNTEFIEVNLSKDGNFFKNTITVVEQYFKRKPKNRKFEKITAIDEKNKEFTPEQLKRSSIKVKIVKCRIYFTINNQQ